MRYGLPIQLREPICSRSVLAVPTAQQYVQMLASLETRIEAMRALVGGVTATELKSARVASDVLAALSDGVSDPNPRVRWWSIQLLDHLSDERALTAVVKALDDPVARVRRNAVHALGCLACKPAWDGALPQIVIEKLRELGEHDPSQKVRAEARRACALPR